MKKHRIIRWTSPKNGFAAAACGLFRPVREFKGENVGECKRCFPLKSDKPVE